MCPIRKYNRGRYVHTGIWIVGIVNRVTGTTVYETVKNRRYERTIRPFVQKYCVGQEIHTDEFKAYSKFGSIGFHHVTVNHSTGQYVRFAAGRDFDDVHTKTIENRWAQLKIKWRMMRGRKRDLLKDYLIEQSYRSRDDVDMYDLFRI